MAEPVADPAARTTAGVRQPVDGQGLVGRIGSVVHAVRGGSRPGEVRVVVDGLPHYYLAYAATALPVGTEVLVINLRGARQVDVVPWPSPAAVPADETGGSL